MNLNKKRIIIIISLLCIVIMGVIAFFYFTNLPVIEFKDKKVTVELNDVYDAKNYISRVNGYDVREVQIDDSQVNVAKLGKYEIKYKINDKEYTLEVDVVDTIAPTLSGLQDYIVIKGAKIDYLKGINAKDNLDTEPKIEVNSEAVDLSKIGTYNVIYTVLDKAGNKNVYTKTVTVSERKRAVSVPANGSKIIYLTFDDGPSANTLKILDILDKYGAKATFFVTGNGQKYNYLIKAAHDRGHTIGLHTYTHKYNKVYSSVDAYFNDLDKIGEMVKGIIGYVPKCIRFPGGSSNKVSIPYTKGIMTILTSEVQNRGYQYYDWNASSGDASGNNVPVSTIVANSTSSRASNIMLLCHDTAAKSTTAQALPQIIEHYQTLGYTFKGIGEDSYSPHQRINN